MVALVSVIEVFVVVVLGLFLYKFIEERKGPTLDETLPNFRKSPMVVTQAGLCTIKKKVQLGPNKYQVFYNEVPYAPIYYKNETFDELVPVDNHQFVFGKTRPILMEHRKVLEMAYGHENAVIRSQLKGQLDGIARTLGERNPSEEDIERYFVQMKDIVNQLGEAPGSYTEALIQHGKANDRAGRYESELRKAESAREGYLQRRIEPILEVAQKRAGSNDRRGNGDNSS